jgi:hypothetical protein
MEQRWLWIALLAACVWGCGNDGNGRARPGVDAGATPAGSCNFAAASTCDEYSTADANTATAGTCTGAGGEWSSGKCPLEGRSGICVDRPAATRTYSYGEQAATALEADCPMYKFTEIKPPPGDPYEPTPDAGTPDTGTPDTGVAPMLPDEDAGM